MIHFAMGGNSALYCSRKVPKTTTDRWKGTLPEYEEEKVTVRWNELIANHDSRYKDVDVDEYERDEVVIAISCNADLKSNDVLYQFCNELERKFDKHFFDVV